MAVLVLLVTGFGQVFAVGGFGDWGRHVHLMVALGLVMMLLFGHLYFAPNRRLQAAVAAGDWPVAGRNLESIRRIVQN
ncbi:MAG: CopD family protein [Pseudomonadota bacterium]